MRKIIFASIFILIFCVSSFAQKDGVSPCPTVEVKGPMGIVPIGKKITFTAVVNENAKDHSFEYKWTIKGGEIIEGQGTSVITVVQSTEIQSASFEAMLEIIGLPDECGTLTVSEVLGCGLISPEPKKIGQFTYTDFEIDKSVLDNFAESLKKEPYAQAYILIGSEKGASKEVFDNKLREISDYLVNKKNVDKSELIFLDVFNTKNLVQLWIIPPGAGIPDEINVLSEKSYIRKNDPNR
jgi:hypothetical protein